MSYRVGQWATGNVGRQALRAIIEHPGLELAGVVVSDPAKVGRDAGELAGIARRIGIRATADPGELIAARPDVISYTAVGTAGRRGVARLRRRRTADGPGARSTTCAGSSKRASTSSPPR
ncbi:hypothetical protein GCM10010411_74130 [Actinomadura fulvescens]|uniref:Dihydrodipicolinate reductase N-terminal domain-containing protein n=1 Tax=Actinomadura fulvescens TaxID=46160 RepID=A0ABN3QH72_9ACTN